MSADASTPADGLPAVPVVERSGARTLRRLRRGVLWTVGVTFAFSVPVVARVAVDGRRALAQAEVAAAAGDVDLQIEYLGRAARWRLPVAGHDERAIEVLLGLGDAAQAEGDAARPKALAAYREVRRALLATRAWGVPHRAILDDVNEHIEVLVAAEEQALETDPDGAGDPQSHLQSLQEIPGPSSVPANLAALSFLLWLATNVGFVWWGIDPSGRVRARSAARWGMASMAALMAWLTFLATV